eukprot:TRINITY_DN10014_c1_g1_i1.p1 TRINITY_DN10014_c1_g1~~TRINITY_DN10014_c1_g1_i1.p1  ORF type:complete len:183 (+),score=34.63 TRINITY_DN10014_c1_g1_i1:65-613(+)
MTTPQAIADEIQALTKDLAWAKDLAVFAFGVAVASILIALTTMSYAVCTLGDLKKEVRAAAAKKPEAKNPRGSAAPLAAHATARKPRGRGQPLPVKADDEAPSRTMPLGQEGEAPPTSSSIESPPASPESPQLPLLHASLPSAAMSDGVPFIPNAVGTPANHRRRHSRPLYGSSPLKPGAHL